MASYTIKKVSYISSAKKKHTFNSKSQATYIFLTKVDWKDGFLNFAKIEKFKIINSIIQHPVRRYAHCNYTFFEFFFFFCLVVIPVLKNGA